MRRLLFFLLVFPCLSAKAALDTALVSRLDSFLNVAPIAEKLVIKNETQRGRFAWRAIGDFEPDSLLSVRFYLTNDLDHPQTVFWKLNTNEYWEIQLQNGASQEVLYTGSHRPVSQRSLPREIGKARCKLAPNTTYLVQLKTYNRSTRPLYSQQVLLLSPRQFYQEQSEISNSARNAFGLSVFFQGAIWIMMLYMFFLYFHNNRDKTYLYYGMYMLFAMYYLLQKIAGDGPYIFLLPDYPIARHLLNEPVQWGIYIFYNLFVLEFLKVKEHSKRLYSFIKKLNWVYLAYLVVESAIMLATYDKVVQSQLFLYSRIFTVAIGIFLIVWMALRVKSQLTKYIVIGSAIFVFFTLTAMFYSLNLSWLPQVNLYPINFMHIGILLEILCFSLGMGRRIRLTALERDRANQSLIEQLEENEAITGRYMKQLESEVKERTEEIIEANKALEIEKEQSLRTRYEKELAQTEMSALRLQMNPHFIFNSLNSIRYFILKEDPESASDYITSFSKLLRIVLQNSKQKLVPLADELEALRLYIEFERHRFDKKFEFSIEVEPNIPTEQAQIQPMIIQPFVENAIWHGLLHKGEPGRLSIRLHLIDETILKIEIEDDGVGRAAAKEIEERQGARPHKSFGLQITKNRLAIMAELTQSQSGCRIVDLVDDQGKPSGTLAILKIKL